jgi:plasmid maintenance system killer protein
MTGPSPATGYDESALAISAGGSWRITCEFRDGHVRNVEIVDYH